LNSLGSQTPTIERLFNRFSLLSTRFLKLVLSNSSLQRNWLTS
jgi:hypothetical protein